MQTWDLINFSISYSTKNTSMIRLVKAGWLEFFRVCYLCTLVLFLRSSGKLRTYNYNREALKSPQNWYSENTIVNFEHTSSCVTTSGTTSVTTSVTTIGHVIQEIKTEYASCWRFVLHKMYLMLCILLNGTCSIIFLQTCLYIKKDPRQRVTFPTMEIENYKSRWL